MNPLRVSCPTCDTVLSIKTSPAPGARFRCPSCGMVFTIGPSAAAPAAQTPLTPPAQKPMPAPALQKKSAAPQKKAVEKIAPIAKPQVKNSSAVTAPVAGMASKNLSLLLIIGGVACAAVVVF